MAMHFLRPPSAMDQSNSVTLDTMRAHSGSPFQGSHGRPSPTPSCYSVYVPDNEQDDEEHMPSYKPPTRNQAHQQQQQPMQVDNGAHVEREEESSHYDAARLEEIQRATAEHNAAYGIADELSTTLWDLKSGTDGPHGKPPYPYLTLIRIALISSENKRMTLQELYDALEARYPYFKSDSKGWKNSIRHNLSLNKCFKKEARHVLDPGKGSYWYVDINEEHSTPRVRHRRKTNENGSGEVFKSNTTSSGPSTRASRKRKQPSPDDSSRLMSPDEMRDVKPRIEHLRLPLSSIVIPPTPGATEVGGSSMQRSISSNGAQLKYGAAASVSGTGRTRAISAPSPVSMAFAGGIQNLAGHPQPYHHHHAHQYGHAQAGFAYGAGNPLASYGGSSYPYHYSTAPVANTIHTQQNGNGQSYTFPAVVGYPQTHYPVDYHPYAIPTTSASYAPYAQEPSTQQQEQVQVPEATAKTAPPADLSGTNSPQNNDISVPSPPPTAKQTSENGPVPDSAATISTLGPETPRSLFSAMLRTQNEASASGVIREQQEDGEGDDKKITGQEVDGTKEGKAESEEGEKSAEVAGEQKASSAPPANLPGPATGYVFPATAPTSVPSSNLRHIPPMSGPQYYSPHGYAGGPLYQYSAHRPTPLPLNTSNFPPSGSGVFSVPPSSTLNGQGKDKVAIWAPSPTTAALIQSPTRLLPSGDYEKLFSSAPFGMMWNENGRKNSRSNSICGVVTR